jgi:D-alanyl-D-alanine carboxypeptidase/D-alanyl-D-alanine-endopeptidase (penicillin-binding protein 4)
MGNRQSTMGNRQWGICNRQLAMDNRQVRVPATSLFFVFCSLFFVFLVSCSTQKQIARFAKSDVLENKALQAAHVGLSIFDPSTNTYLYNYQGDKYFVPASNTKIPTCYAAMKYLGDSLVGLRYNDTLDYFVIEGAGDPTFLHPDFKSQPVYDQLKNVKRRILINDQSDFTAQPLGNGWAWNDFRESYMVERSPMPMYGNILKAQGKLANLKVVPEALSSHIHVNTSCCSSGQKELFTRSMETNSFYFKGDSTKEYSIEIPLSTKQYSQLLLINALKKTDVAYIHHYLIGFPLLVSALE